MAQLVELSHTHGGAVWRLGGRRDVSENLREPSLSSHLINKERGGRGGAASPQVRFLLVTARLFCRCTPTSLPSDLQGRNPVESSTSFKSLRRYAKLP